MNLNQKKFQKQLEQKVEAHFIYDNCEFKFQKNMWKGVQLANFAIFRRLMISNIAPQNLIFSNIEEPYDKLPKH